MLRDVQNDLRPSKHHLSSLYKRVNAVNAGNAVIDDLGIKQSRPQFMSDQLLRLTLLAVMCAMRSVSSDQRLVRASDW